MYATCPAAVNSTTGNAPQAAQATSTGTNVPICRYWGWRFDRIDDLSSTNMTEDFWTKSEAQAVADLKAASVTDATLGIITGPTDIELAVDPYFPKNIPTVSPELLGHTIHAGGRCRVYLDGHTQYLKDTRTPL
jgi:hypothetical protein